jgi:hypothetical protein
VWEKAGDPRALFYNGPEVHSGDKWLKVQLPVRQRQLGEQIPTGAFRD